MSNDTVSFKVSLVGHSQLPGGIHLSQVDLRTYRSPGARADSFYENGTLCEVLEWPHDLCILWIGSNDIEQHSVPAEITNNIVGIVQTIEEATNAIVWVVKLEHRFYQEGGPVTQTDYRKIQRGVNKKLESRLSNRLINFNSEMWVELMGEDGVHWSQEGKQRIRKRFRKLIREFMECSDSE